MVVSRQMMKERGADLLKGLTSVREGWIELGAKEITLQTPMGTSINGLHFIGHEKKAIIHLHGNGCFYETSLQRPLSWKEALQGAPHLVVCNPGGTGKSEGGFHPETVAQELLAQFEYLVNEYSIDPSDIVISGHSMGGYLGAFGAELIQRKHPDKQINFLSDRSFASIYSRIDACMGNNRMVQLAMYCLAKIAGWAKDPINALESLRGRVCIIYHEQDRVIPYQNSLHLALTSAIRAKQYTCIQLQGDDEGAHMREFTNQEHERVIEELKKMLKLSP